MSSMVSGYEFNLQNSCLNWGENKKFHKETFNMDVLNKDMNAEDF